MPIDGVGVVGGLLDLPGEVRLQPLEVVDVDRDARALHAGEHVHERQLDVGEQPGATPLLELGVERVGQVEDGPRLQHRGVAGGVLPHAVEGQLAVVDVLTGLELALEVAQRQVGQVVGALVGAREVGRQRGVGRQAARGPSRARRGRASAPWRRAAPWARGVREPGRQHLVVLGGDLLDVEPGRGAVTGGEREREHVAGARAPAALRPARRAGVRRGVLGEPARHRTGLQAGPVELEAASSISSSASRVSKSRSRSTRNSRLSKTLWTSSRSQGRAARSAVSAAGRGRRPAR